MCKQGEELFHVRKFTEGIVYFRQKKENNYFLRTQY